MQHKLGLKQYLMMLLALLMVLPQTACSFFEMAADSVSSPSVVINEVVSSNGQSLLNDVYGSPDWVELKNVGKTSVSLLGMRITDNIQNTDKAYVLPDVTLEPGAFLILFANKEETDFLAYENGPICIGFSLKLAGENLALEDANMQLVQELTVPELMRDVSYARKDDGTYGFCAEPTPGAENSTTIYATLSEVPVEVDDSVFRLAVVHCGSRHETNFAYQVKGFFCHFFVCVLVCQTPQDIFDIPGNYALFHNSFPLKVKFT